MWLLQNISRVKFARMCTYPAPSKYPRKTQVSATKCVGSARVNARLCWSINAEKKMDSSCSDTEIISCSCWAEKEAYRPSSFTKGPFHSKTFQLVNGRPSCLSATSSFRCSTQKIKISPTHLKLTWGYRSNGAFAKKIKKTRLQVASYSFLVLNWFLSERRWKLKHFNSKSLFWMYKQHQIPVFIPHPPPRR